MKDYEKLYKKAFEAVKELQKANPSDEGIQNWVYDNFPELADSEDERIRNGIISFIKFALDDESAIAPGINVTKEEALAWLEKQGEQKSVERKHIGMDLDEDKMTPFQKEVFNIVDLSQEEEKGLSNICDKLLSLAAQELEQKPAWSKEDEFDYENANIQQKDFAPKTE